MALVGVSFSLLMCYSERILTEAQGLVEVDLDPFGSNQFMSCLRAMSFL